MRKPVVLLWFFVACFGVKVLVSFYLMFVHNFLSGKSLVSRVFSLYFVYL